MIVTVAGVTVAFAWQSWIMETLVMRTVTVKVADVMALAWPNCKMAPHAMRTVTAPVATVITPSVEGPVMAVMEDSIVTALMIISVVATAVTVASARRNLLMAVFAAGTRIASLVVVMMALVRRPCLLAACATRTVIA
jgi:glutamate racemase